jgi:hypothetical protein
MTFQHREYYLQSARSGCYFALPGPVRYYLFSRPFFPERVLDRIADVVFEATSDVTAVEYDFEEEEVHDISF